MQAGRCKRVSVDASGCRDMKLYAADGSQIITHGTVALCFNNADLSFTVTFVVAAVLGMDFLSLSNATVRFGTFVFECADRRVNLVDKAGERLAMRLVLMSDVVLPPNSESLVPVCTQRCCRYDGTGLVEGSIGAATELATVGRTVARSLVSCDQEYTTACILNMSTRPVKLRRGHCVGRLTRSSMLEVADACDHPIEQCRTIKASGGSAGNEAPDHVKPLLNTLPHDCITPDTKLSIEAQLAEFADVFCKGRI